MWQWWLYTRVWLCKAHDAMCNGFGKEPPRLTGASDATLLMRCEHCAGGRGGVCNCCSSGSLEWNGWLIVRPSRAPARPRVSLLGAAWRDIRMLVGTAPSPILDYLWIGSALDACNESWVNSSGITGIVNVTTEVPNFFAANGVEYLNWIVRDEKDADITVEMLETTAQFIDRHVRKAATAATATATAAHDSDAAQDDDERAASGGGGVLVHCFVGRSRSVAVCCYYLITRRNRTLYEAYQDICGARPIAQINTRFVRALQEGERRRGVCRIDTGN